MFSKSDLNKFFQGLSDCVFKGFDLDLFFMVDSHLISWRSDLDLDHMCK